MPWRFSGLIDCLPKLSVVGVEIFGVELSYLYVYLSDRVIGLRPATHICVF